MKRLAIPLVVALVTGLLVLPAFAQHAALQCTAGPVKKTYGNTPWLVYGCDDRKSIVIVTAHGSPAFPFYFTLTVVIFAAKARAARQLRMRLTPTFNA